MSKSASIGTSTGTPSNQSVQRTQLDRSRAYTSQVKILTGIASTTHVDRQGDRMAKEALDSMAAQIKAKYIRMLVNHDASQPALGVLLYAQVAPVADGEHALLVVGGFFESEEESIRYMFGAENTEWDQHAHHLDGLPENLLTRPVLAPEERQVEGHPNNLADRLERFLNSTAIWVDGSVYDVKYLIASIGDLQIHVYRDHPPPHFHVISKQRGLDGRFDLETLDLIGTKRGAISSADERKVKEYFRRNPQDLERLRDEHKRMQS